MFIFTRVYEWGPSAYVLDGWEAWEALMDCIARRTSCSVRTMPGTDRLCEITFNGRGFSTVGIRDARGGQINLQPHFLD